MTILNDLITGVTENRNNWPSLVNPMVHDELPSGRALIDPLVETQKTGLLPDAKYRFSGTNQTKNTRRPQGVIQYGSSIINTWYFRQSIYSDNCKFTVTDTTPGGKGIRNVCPVQLNSSGKFIHIDTHAGGAARVGDYMYIADSTTQSIRVFDLRCFYNRVENISAVSSSDAFLNLYNDFLPQVGQIFMNTPGNANTSYMSVSGNNFLVGNFYSTTRSSWAKGGKTMLWLIPMGDYGHEFMSADSSSNQCNQQLEPLFPSGSNKDTTLTRVQGALLTENNELILNRSYLSSSMQLILMKYANLNDLSTPVGFFSGTESEPQIHDAKNWLYGSEDWSFSDDGSQVITTTEFKNRRQIFVWDKDAILGLIS